MYYDVLPERHLHAVQYVLYLWIYVRIHQSSIINTQYHIIGYYSAGTVSNFVSFSHTQNLNILLTIIIA